jgi:hypothetical protein
VVVVEGVVGSVVSVVAPPPARGLVATSRGAVAPTSPATFSRQAFLKPSPATISRERRESREAEKAHQNPGCREFEGEPDVPRAEVTLLNPLKYVQAQKIIMRKVAALSCMAASLAHTRMAPSHLLRAAHVLTVATKASSWVTVERVRTALAVPDTVARDSTARNTA